MYVVCREGVSETVNISEGPAGRGVGASIRSLRIIGDAFENLGEWSRRLLLLSLGAAAQQGRFAMVHLPAISWGLSLLSLEGVSHLEPTGWGLRHPVSSHSPARPLCWLVDPSASPSMPPCLCAGLPLRRKPLPSWSTCSAWPHCPAGRPQQWYPYLVYAPATPPYVAERAASVWAVNCRHVLWLLSRYPHNSLVTVGAQRGSMNCPPSYSRSGPPKEKERKEKRKADSWHLPISMV